MTIGICNMNNMNWTRSDETDSALKAIGMTQSAGVKRRYEEPTGTRELEVRSMPEQTAGVSLHNNDQQVLQTAAATSA
jgi:hypothetical protein